MKRFKRSKYEILMLKATLWFSTPVHILCLLLLLKYLDMLLHYVFPCKHLLVVFFLSSFILLKIVLCGLNTSLLVKISVFLSIKVQRVQHDPERL